MSGLIDLVADPKVHDTVLITMIVNSFLAAIRRFKNADKAWKVFWNFLYDWVTGFWSMKSGHPVTPLVTQQLETHTDGTQKDVSLVTTSSVDPSQPVIPAQPK